MFEFCPVFDKKFALDESQCYFIVGPNVFLWGKEGSKGASKIVLGTSKAVNTTMDKKIHPRPWTK